MSDKGRFRGDVPEKGSSAPGNLTSLRDILFTLFKYKWVIVLTVAVSLVSTGAYIWIKDDSYEISAKVLVKMGRESAPPPSVITRNPTVVNQQANAIKSEIEILKSRELLEKVVETLKLYQPHPVEPPERFFPWLKYKFKDTTKSVRQSLGEVLIRMGMKERLTPRESALLELIKGLRVESAKDSNVIEVKMIVGFKKYSSAILNTLLKFYLERHMDAYRNEGVSEFFDVQTEHFREKLDSSEKALERFKAVNDVTALKEQKGLLLERLLKTTAEIEETQSSIAVTESRLRVNAELMRAQRPDLPGPGGTGRSPEGREASLTGVSSPEGGASPQAPPLIDIGFTETYTKLRKLSNDDKLELAALRGKLEALKSQEADHKERLNTLNRNEREINVLSRAVDVDEADYMFYKKKREEARVVDAMDLKGISNVTVIESATDPILPLGMRKVYVVGTAIVMGFVGALGIVFTFEILDHSVYSPEQVEKTLGVTNLATIEKKKLGLTGRRAAFSPGRWGDEYTPALTGIKGALGREGPRTVLISASSRGEGTTTTALNLAGVAREMLGWNVLAVEMNQRNPVFPELLGIRGGPGVSAIIDGSATPEESVARVEGIDFDLIPFLPADDVFLDIQLRDAVLRISRVLGGKYDLIIFDGPPVAPHGDFFGIAPAVDGTILVVESAGTREEVLQRVRVQTERQEIRLMGAVLNKRKYVIPSFIYNWI